jgi:hypothetical protein
MAWILGVAVALAVPFVRVDLMTSSVPASLVDEDGGENLLHLTLQDVL